MSPFPLPFEASNLNWRTFHCMGAATLIYIEKMEVGGGRHGLVYHKWERQTRIATSASLTGQRKMSI